MGYWLRAKSQLRGRNADHGPFPGLKRKYWCDEKGGMCFCLQRLRRNMFCHVLSFLFKKHIITNTYPE